MLKEESSVLNNIETNNWARPCDYCCTAVCCHADSAYTYPESARSLCQVCKWAPAAFLCKADSASLCTACDKEVHSANPLARRHHRVPILPISGTDYENFFKYENEDASWLLLNPTKNDTVFSYGEEAVDGFLDLGDYNSTCEDNQFTDQYGDQRKEYSTYPQKGYIGDNVVSVQSEMKSQSQQQHHSYQFEVDYKASKTGYSYRAPSSHGVSVSLMDVGVVSESLTSDVPISHPKPPKSTIDLFSNPPVQMPTQRSPKDREARVLRYWEKKKTRKFEKTIRYASRKAYAETRLRIKGRFAKRTELEVEVDQMFSTSVFAEGGYGIVPSY